MQKFLRLRALVAALGVWTAVAMAVAAAQTATSTASFDSHGVAIQFADSGRGTPVVLIHGFTGSYQRHWEAAGVIQALERAGHRVIAFDCRGHGNSGKPRDPGAYGLEMVEDVVRLLDHLHIARAHIVGYSLGGAIANQLAVRHPTRVVTVALIGAGWEGEDLASLRSQFSKLADGFANRDASAFIGRILATGSSGPSDADIAALNRSLFARNDPDVLAAITRGIVPLFELSADDLRNIRVPMLAIVGENDRSNVVAVERMATAVRTLEVIKIPEADHVTSVSRSAPHLVTFLNKHDADEYRLR